jgi:hypothetical protein
MPASNALASSTPLSNETPALEHPATTKSGQQIRFMVRAHSHVLKRPLPERQWVNGAL